MNGDFISIADIVNSGKRIINIIIRKEPVLPEPVQVPTGNIVECIEKIPGYRVFSVPSVHIFLQAFFKQVITQQIHHGQVAQRRFTIFVDAKPGAQVGPRRNDREVDIGNVFIGPPGHPE